MGCARDTLGSKNETDGGIQTGTAREAQRRRETDYEHYLMQVMGDRLHESREIT